jgi:hypothetical protein
MPTASKNEGESEKDPPAGSGEEFVSLVPQKGFCFWRKYALDLIGLSFRIT